MGKIYRNMRTNEIVLEEDANEYVLDQLGLTITAKGKNGEFTSDQIEFIEETKEWFLSGNWIKEDVEDE